MTLLGVSKMIDKCVRGRRQQSKLNPRADYACFDDHHFTPFVVTTQPYESLSHATLEWLKEHQDKCDVLQVTCLSWLQRVSISMPSRAMMPLSCVTRLVCQGVFESSVGL